ncbi:MAG: M23 family metallopeptidase, partial [Gemmatimonadota bacterium]
MYDPTAERCSFLAGQVRESPELGEELFTSRFLEEVGADRVAGMLAACHRQHGPVVEVESVGPLRPGAWVLRWRYAGGVRQLVHVAVEASPPHRIASLLFGPPWDPDDVDETEPARTSFRLPFRGRWHVTWGGRTLQENYHRSAESQRYAYDFSIVRGNAFCRGDGTRNEDHYCFGEDALAPAAGRVVRAVDGVSDNVPGRKNDEHPLGNFVVVEHRENEFSMLAHLKEGSIRVEPGSSVAAEQEVGECG